MHGLLQLIRNIWFLRPKMAQAVISDNNLVPLIQIISWFMLVVAIFGIFLRALSKTYVIHRVGTDDSLVFLALVGFIFPILYGLTRRRAYDSYL